MSLIVLFVTYPVVNPGGNCVITSQGTNADTLPVASGSVMITLSQMQNVEGPPVVAGTSASASSRGTNTDIHPRVGVPAADANASATLADVHPIVSGSALVVDSNTNADVHPRAGVGATIASLNAWPDIHPQVGVGANHWTAQTVTNTTSAGAGSRGLVSSHATELVSSGAIQGVAALLASFGTNTDLHPRLGATGSALSSSGNEFVFTSGRATGVLSSHALGLVSAVGLGAPALASSHTTLAESNPQMKFFSFMSNSGLSSASVTHPLVRAGGEFLSSTANASGSTQGVPITGHLLSSALLVLTSPHIVTGQSLLSAAATLPPTHAKIGATGLLSDIAATSGTEGIINQASASGAMHAAALLTLGAPHIAVGLDTITSELLILTSNFVPAKPVKQAQPLEGETAVDIELTSSSSGPT